jgi:ribosomal protein S12 methylthiotransferase accessory factor
VELIHRIEQSGRFKVLVKDCSLEQGFPVVGVVLVDPQSQGYFVRLGAHPIFFISLERCLTELLQGRDLNRGLSQMFTPFDYGDEKADQPLNKNTLLRIGKGSYPKEFFSLEFSYAFKSFKDVSGYSNPEMLRYLTGLILEQGYTVLVRDVSYLGFPSYQVLVPGMSEVFEFFDDDKLIYQTIREEVKKTMRHLC